ncbi:hypothetical protein CSPX01_10664 [Colletotrichum filicis]|nr:hypothetical protein CSPX01_10664 [Colletotrichum filicis]
MRLLITIARKKERRIKSTPSRFFRPACHHHHFLGAGQPKSDGINSRWPRTMLSV